MDGGNWRTSEDAPTTTNQSTSSSSVPFCYSWLIDLESTLNSVQGTKALESYLVRSDSLPLLEFIWACDGMKSLVEENPDKTDQLVSCIFKNYIISGVLPVCSNQVVLTIARRLEAYFERPEPSDHTSPKINQQRPRENMENERKLDLKIFDDARTEVEGYLRDIIFPEFRRAVEIGNICIGGRNGGGSSGSRLASHPEAFAMALCEKLEGLQLKRKE